jgi:hypothetical protein
MLGKRNPHTQLVGRHANAATMENSMEAPQKTKNRTATLSCYTTLGHISEGIKVSIQHRHLHPHIYCSIIHNSQAMESTQETTSDEWIKGGTHTQRSIIQP